MLRALLTLLLAASTTVRAVAQTPGADPPLLADPRLVRGTLENGLSYTVLRHDNPPGRAIVYLHVHSGSLNETDRQRGVAHYLEHMAFNGSENFPPGTVIKTFEELGLTFGQHQNASTGFNATTYQLALPDNSPEKLDTALRFLADVNSRLLLDEGEIDRERRIILEEKGARQSPQQRLMEIIYSRFAPGSIYGERMPIGTVESINGLTRQDFVDYYESWYGTGNSTLLVVADLDPAMVVDEITRAFGPLPAKPRPTPRDPGVSSYTTSFAAVATDPELTRATVSMTRIGKARPPARTESEYRARLVRDLATGAFNRRMRDLVTEGRASFLGGTCFANNLSGAIWQAQAQAGGDPAKWRDMLKDLGEQVQLARLHGFTDEEIERVRKDTLAFREQRAATEDTAPARAIIARLNTELSSGEVSMSAAQGLDLARRLLPTITAGECSDWFSAEFEPVNVMFAAQLPTGEGVPSEAEFKQLAESAFAAAPAKVDRAARADRLLDAVPAPGRMLDISRHETSGVTNAWLDNGARYHHRFMEYRRNYAAIAITLYGGQLLETAANRGVTQAAVQAWTQQATTTLTSADIRSLMTGKRVSITGSADLDSIQLVVSGAPEDLETGMQLAYLLLTDPVLEATAFDRWKTGQLQNIEATEKNPGQKFTTLIAEAVYPEGEARGKALTREAVNALSREAAQAWLRALIADSPIEVAVVGDVAEARAADLVRTYIGSLSARKRISPTTFADRRALVRPAGPRRIDRTIATATPQARVMVGFYGPDRKNLADVRAMNIAARILSSRMIDEVREESQLAYSIGASLVPGGVFPGFGILRASSPTQPENAEALAKKLTSMFANFAERGPTEQELVTAKKQLANTQDESMKEPFYWLGVLELKTQAGTNLDDVLAMPAAYQAVTAEEVLAAFRRYHTPGNMLSVVLRPVPLGEKPAGCDSDGKAPG